MSKVSVRTEESNKPTFFIQEGETMMGEMNASQSQGELVVTHTEVAPEAQGKGVAKQLFEAMINYARENNLKVTAQCSYVRTQLQRNAESYKDVWAQS